MTIYKPSKILEFIKKVPKEFVFIVLLIIGLAGTYYKYKTTDIELQKALTENETMRKALENPMIVEKPVIKERIVYRYERIKQPEPKDDKDYLVDYTPETDETDDYRIIERIEEREVDLGSIIRPILPGREIVSEMPTWAVSAGYNFDGKYASVAVYRRVYKSLMLGVEYNLDQSVELNSLLIF